MLFVHVNGSALATGMMSGDFVIVCARHLMKAIIMAKVIILMVFNQHTTRDVCNQVFVTFGGLSENKQTMALKRSARLQTSRSDVNVQSIAWS